jgi:hypothetical protein
MSVILLYTTSQIYIILLPEKIILPDILPDRSERLILVSVHAMLKHEILRETIFISFYLFF